MKANILCVLTALILAGCGDTLLPENTMTSKYSKASQPQLNDGTIVNPPASGSGSSGTIQITNHQDLVSQIRSQINPTDEVTAFEVTKRVAWALRNEGAGLLIKNAGSNVVQWNGMNFSAGRIVYQDGHIIKVLSDVGPGGANGAQWLDDGFINTSQYVPAMNPGS